MKPVSGAHRLLSVIGWDGALPLGVVLAPALVRATFPRGHVAEIGTTVFVPIAAALLRSALAWDHLARASMGPPSMRRQLALAVAIIALLVFEILTGALVLAGNDPPAAWCVAAGFYAAYFILIGWALRPVAKETA